jgi:hypothetical protein
MIKDIIDEFDTPPIPIVMRRPARGHYVCPHHAQPATRSQLRECTAHMINSTVSDALMPRLVTAKAGTPPAIRYAFALHQLALRKLATGHFIGTIIIKDTVLFWSTVI